MIRFLIVVCTGDATVYIWPILQLATPETETTGDGSYPWPPYI